MLFATLDLDLLEDPAFKALEDEHPGGLFWYLRLVQFAKRYKASKGRVLRADGTPILPWMLAMTHHGSRQRAGEWALFLDLCVELGILRWLDDEQCYEICNWKRWHRAPSALPESVAERVKRHRNLPGDGGVTRCNEVKRAVTNVTTHSIAEHSIAEHSKTEQSIAEQPRAREAEGAGPPVTPTGGCEMSVGVRLLETMRLVGWRFNGSVEAKARVTIEQLCSDCGGEQLAHDAAREAVRETLFRMHNEKRKPISNPAAFCLSLLAEHLVCARAQERANRQAAERGKTAGPYRYRAPEGWLPPPVLEGDFYLAQSPLAADLAALPRPRAPGPPEPPELSPDTEAMIAALAGKKAIE